MSTMDDCDGTVVASSCAKQYHQHSERNYKSYMDELERKTEGCC